LHAVERFLADAETRGLAKGSMKLYRILLQKRFLSFCERKHIRFMRQLGLERIREFRESWKLAPLTSNDRLKKLRSFLRFAVDSGWAEENPAKSLKPAIVSSSPTLPFEKDEMDRILEACARYKDRNGRVGAEAGSG
jgi:site-specific recombinase XerD